MIAVISFEFVELAMHLDTTQDTAFPTLPEAELAQKLCVKTFFFFLNVCITQQHVNVVNVSADTVSVYNKPMAAGYV